MTFHRNLDISHNFRATSKNYILVERPLNSPQKQLCMTFLGDWELFEIETPMLTKYLNFWRIRRIQDQNYHPMVEIYITKPKYWDFAISVNTNFVPNSISKFLCLNIFLDCSLSSRDNFRILLKVKVEVKFFGEK